MVINLNRLLLYCCVCLSAAMWALCVHWYPPHNMSVWCGYHTYWGSYSRKMENLPPSNETVHAGSAMAYATNSSPRVAYATRNESMASDTCGICRSDTDFRTKQACGICHPFLPVCLTRVAYAIPTHIDAFLGWHMPHPLPPFVGWWHLVTSCWHICHTYPPLVWHMPHNFTNVVVLTPQ